MFANTFQSGFISVFYSVGSNPLAIWEKKTKNGHIRRVVDEEVKSLVLEIGGTNVTTTYITCPQKPRASLGIRLPFFVMIIKNMKKYFTFEIQIKDDKDMNRRFRVSNFQSTTKVLPFCTTMPIGLAAGWNQVQFNLADFTKRAYGSTYVETVRLQIHANVRIRRIYFSDMLYHEDELPNEYKLFVPTPGRKSSKVKETKKASVDIEQKKPLPGTPEPSEHSVHSEHTTLINSIHSGVHITGVITTIRHEVHIDDDGEKALPTPADRTDAGESDMEHLDHLSAGEGIGPTGYEIDDNIIIEEPTTEDEEGDEDIKEKISDKIEATPSIERAEGSPAEVEQEATVVEEGEILELPSEQGAEEPPAFEEPPPPPPPVEEQIEQSPEEAAAIE